MVGVRAYDIRCIVDKARYIHICPSAEELFMEIDEIFKLCGTFHAEIPHALDRECEIFTEYVGLSAFDYVQSQAHLPYSNI